MADARESQSHPDTNVGLDAPAPAPNDTSTEMSTEAAQLEGSSDAENERTTRERLKKTSLAGIAQQAKITDEDSRSAATTTSSAPTNQGDLDLDGSGNGTRGRPAKKRSFEDLNRGDGAVDGNGEVTGDADQPNPKSGHHKRMRSRDVVSGEHALARFGGPASPVQEESDAEAHKSPGGPGVLVDPQTVKGEASEKTTEEMDQGSTATDVAAQSKAPNASSSSGFANTSSASPFGTTQKTSSSASISGNDSTSTSASAFASSGLSAFASSEKSPFGVAAQSSGGFGSKSSSTGFGSSSTGFGGSAFGAKQSNGGFGSSTGFGTSSGFGTATGFGSAKPFGTGASVFGGAAGTNSGFGTGKPFTSSKDKETDETGSDEDDEDEESGQPDTTDEQDERFVAQDVETGEEEEQTIFACRAKLYHFEKEWKERGVGTVKINMKEEQIDVSEAEKETAKDEEAGEESDANGTIRRARLIMRTDGVHRVILNTPIFKSMTIGDTDGSEPIGKTMHLTGLEDGKPRAFQIKIGKEEVIKELYWKVISLRKEAK